MRLLDHAPSKLRGRVGAEPLRQPCHGRVVAACLIDVSNGSAGFRPTPEPLLTSMRQIEYNESCYSLGSASEPNARSLYQRVGARTRKSPWP